MIEKSNNGMTVKQLAMRFNEGNLKFDHPAQRRGEQWNKEQKSLLIHSVIDDYPIPRVYAVKEAGKKIKGRTSQSYSVIDGQQRLTTILSYLNNEFELDSSTPLFKKGNISLDLLSEIPVEDEEPQIFSVDRAIIEDGEVVGFDAKGLKASDLPEDMFDELRTRSLSIEMYEDTITDDEIEEILFRLNNGKAMTSIQKTKARIGTQLLAKLTPVLNHPFMKETIKFTPAQQKAEKDLEIILTFVMLAARKNDPDFALPSSVSAAYISKFGSELKNKGQNFVDHLISEVEQTLNYLYDGLEGMETEKEFIRFMKPMNVISVFGFALDAKDEGTSDLASFIQLFINDYTKQNESNIYVSDYRLNSGEGTTKKRKFEARIKILGDAYLYDMKNLLAE